MNVKFNPTGTHLHKGHLKIRLDVYPDVTAKTYPLHHIQVPVIPEAGYPGEVDKFGAPIDRADYDAWLASLPTVWQLNPCLCHFVKVDDTTTRAQLDALVTAIFDAPTLKALDDTLSGTGSQVPRIMASKRGDGEPTAIVDVSPINDRLTAEVSRGN